MSRLIEFTTTIEVTVIARVTPAVPKPDIQDHDHPSFGDTGSPAVVVIEKIDSGNSQDITTWLDRSVVDEIKERAIVEEKDGR